MSDRWFRCFCCDIENSNSNLSLRARTWEKCYRQCLVSNSNWIFDRSFLQCSNEFSITFNIAVYKKRIVPIKICHPKLQACIKPRLNMSELTTFSRRKRPGCASCTVPEDSKSSRDEIKTVRIKQTPRSNLKSSGRRDLEKPVIQKKLVQMFLDVGQKNFFSTTCSECGFVYTPGKNEEERLHMSHHNQALSLNLMKFKKIPQGTTLLMDDGTMGKIYKMYYFKNSQGNTKSIMVRVNHIGVCA